MKKLLTLLLTFGLAFGTMTLVGCEDSTSDNVQDAVEDVQDNAEDVGEDISDSAENAGDSIQDSAEDVGEELDN